MAYPTQLEPQGSIDLNGLSKGGPITQEMLFLSDGISAQEKLLAALSARLSPILPDSPSTKSGAREEPRNGPVHCTPLGRQLQEIGCRLALVNRHLEHLLDSVGV